jgi:hypothetical protein
MPTLEELCNLRYNSGDELHRRIAAAVATAASTILGEGAEVTGHAQRLIWAKSVLAGDVRQTANQFIWSVVANPVIAANPTTATDNDIQWVVNQVVNTFAGVS